MLKDDERSRRLADGPRVGRHVARPNPTAGEYSKSQREQRADRFIL